MRVSDRQVANLSPETPSPRGLLIHIGLHKTGTTWLQAILFNPDGGHRFLQPWPEDEVLGRIVLPAPLHFDPLDTRESFRGGLERANRSSVVPVISEERLSGNPDAGSIDRKEIADRLAATFPGARILIVIREQAQMILSTWREYIRQGGTETLRHYVNPRWHQVWLPVFNPAQFEYHKMIDYYRALFGEENVLTLVYEQLRADPPGFAAAIADFAGAGAPGTLDSTPRNVNLKGPSCDFKRILNRLFARSSFNRAPPLRFPGSHRVALSISWLADRFVSRKRAASWEDRRLEELRAMLGDRYAHSNRLTAMLTGIDLKAHGYVT